MSHQFKPIFARIHTKTILIIFFLLTAFVKPSTALTLVNVTDESLMATSQLAVRGTVDYVTSRFEDDGIIYTIIRIKISEVLKGKEDSDVVVIKQMGGVVGKTGLSEFGMAKFAAGEDVVVLLRQIDGGYYFPEGWALGKFTVTISNGKESVQRDTRDITILNNNMQKNRAPSSTFDLSNLTNKIRESSPSTLASIPFSKKYYDDLNADATKVYTPQYDYYGARWFPQDIPYTMYINLNNNPLSDSTAIQNAIQEGFDAWNNQLISTLITLGGTTAVTGGKGTKDNVVAFGDPTDAIADPSGCSGTFAWAGLSWTTGSKMIVGSITLNKATTGHLTFNNGWDDCGILDQYTPVVEIAAHEAGHVLGFGHSSDLMALMYPSLSADGHWGAILEQDDLDVLYAIYAELNPSTIPALSTEGMIIAIILISILATRRLRIKC